MAVTAGADTATAPDGAPGPVPGTPAGSVAARFGPPLLLIGAVLIVWEAYCRLAGVSPIVLPAPTRILEQLWRFRDDAVRHTLPTLGEALLGMGLSIAV